MPLKKKKKLLLPDDFLIIFSLMALGIVPRSLFIKYPSRINFSMINVFNGLSKKQKSQISKCLHDTTTKDATTYIIGLIESSMLIDASSLEKQNMKLLCNYLKRFRLFFLSAFLKQYPTTLPSVSVKDINTAAIRALYLVSGI